MGADSVLQLRGLLVGLPTARKEEVSRICTDLLQLGRRWPEQPLEDEQKAFDSLGRQLAKFSEPQQRELVSTFRPLREDVQRRLVKAATDLNTWLAEAPDKKASPESLTAILQAIDGAPQLHWYKQCTSAEVKGKFLMALAAVVRNVQADSAPLHAHVAALPSVLPLIDRVSSRFFAVPTHGNILKPWHDGRLKRYNATLWRAAKSAADQFKDDLQVRLVTALRRKAASQVSAKDTKAKLQLELCRWPMVKCPLANAFLDFVAQRGHELGDLGKPSLSECPPHTLRPRTLRKLLERLDAFELVDGGPNKDGPSIVRLRWEAVTALAFKALGTKPKASSAPPLPIGKAGAPAPAESATSAPSSPARSGSVEPPVGKAAPRPPAQARRNVAEDRPVPLGASRLKAEGQTADGLESDEESYSLDDESNAPPGNTAAAVGGRVNVDPLKAKTMEQPAANRARVAPIRPREASSSGSETSQSLKPAKRRKKKNRQAGLLGYGAGMNFGGGENPMGMTPEMMMMNQMMGMSMMMNNPLAMMGMGAGMMPHQMSAMMPGAAGMKLKVKDDKSKKAKIDAKLKRDPYEEQRLLRKQKDPVDPRPHKPIAANVAAAKPSYKDSTIDAADL